MTNPSSSVGCAAKPVSETGLLQGKGLFESQPNKETKGKPQILLPEGGENKSLNIGVEITYVY